MSNTNYIDTLVKLTECTFKNGENIQQITETLEPCKNCYLTCNPILYKNKKKERERYPLVFFDDVLKTKGKEAVKIMVISRDPNLDDRRWGGLRDDIQQKEKEQVDKKNTAILKLIKKLVGDESMWSTFKNFVCAKSKVIPAIYWTHLTKCYALNDSCYAKVGANQCIELLKEEIDYLDPSLIIGLGKDVQKALLHKLSKEDNRRYSYEWLEDLEDIMDKLTKTETDKNIIIVILPHPSGNNRVYAYRWENGYKENDYKKAIIVKKKLKRCTKEEFSLLPLKNRIKELLQKS